MAEEVSYPPWNFSWVVENKLAAMAWPETESNLQYIIRQGINHLVTLSPEKLPPVHTVPDIKWTVISIQEFEAPSIDQIKQFIDICDEADKTNKVVGIHCRMGRGRTGTMAACYLVWFLSYHPEHAVTTIRLTRPGSVETYQQETAVKVFFDHLKGTTL